MPRPYAAELAALQAELAARGARVLGLHLARRDDTPLSHVKADVVHALRAYLDGRTHPLPPAGDSRRSMPAIA